SPARKIAATSLARLRHDRFFGEWPIARMVVRICCSQASHLARVQEPPATVPAEAASLDKRQSIAMPTPPVGGLYDVAALSFEFYPDPREQEMVAALRQGDEKAFAWLVEQHHATLVRLALRYLPDIAAAEDVAQETWVQVVQGLGRFEFRSSLKTWMVSI